MISKYAGTCVLCKKPTKAGVDQYDLDLKESFHLACKQDQEDNPKPTPEQFELAIRLGYKPVDGNLLLLPNASGRQPERDEDGAPGRD